MSSHKTKIRTHALIAKHCSVLLPSNLLLVLRTTAQAVKSNSNSGKNKQRRACMMRFVISGGPDHTGQRDNGKYS